MSLCSSSACYDDEYVDYNQIPKLLYPHHVPNVKWQQNKSTICLTIEATDVQDYYLRTTNNVINYW